MGADHNFPPKVAGTRPSGLSRPQRLFFIVFGVAFFIVAALGFGPHLRAFVAGTFPISPVAHVHGALMTSWLLTFCGQAWFAATGRMDLHRRIGAAAMWLGVAIWMSFVALTVRGFLETPYPVHENIYYSLPQLYIIVVFAPLLAGAFMTRTKPQWHKRLIAIATITVLQAAVDRFGWLPPMAPSYWPQVLCLDILLVPLVAYDIVHLKRIHPATLAGGVTLLLGQTVAALLWPSTWWQTATHAIAGAMLR